MSVAILKSPGGAPCAGAKAKDGAGPDQLENPAVALLAATLLAACGGGAEPGSPPAAPTPTPTPTPTPVPDTISPIQASRFLAQSSMGATREHIASVQAQGYAGWIDEQFAAPQSATRWDYLVSKAYNAIGNKNSQAGADNAMWKKILSSPDTLRQRVTMALSEIAVVAVDGFVGSGWRAFSAAAYLDLLESNAFGNYRTLLQQVSLSAAMGEFLTFRGNTKFNPNTGALPDENYARELMQLFSIGLLQLNLDGTPKQVGGVNLETYTLDDITGLARVFTGWDYDLGASKSTDVPDFKKRPMVQVASRNETGAKTFLGSSVPAGLDGTASLTKALDIIFSHANVAPFISRQLIQRLVTSNPAPAYVARVAALFNNDGTGVKGNMKAVIKAILLDDEARNPARLGDNSFGKQREPILRFVAWARAFKATSASDDWSVGNTSDPVSRLGQSPLRSATVFNFFRPGYVPPNSLIGTAGLVAPEFQITNESTVVGYVNYMQTVISKGVGDVKADYASLLPLADSAQALIDEVNLVLAAGQLSAATVGTIKSAIDTMAAGANTARLNRIYATLVLVMSSPEFIVQK